MQVSELLRDAAVGFLAVFAGLFVLWSAMRLMTPGQRATNAAVAGLVSAAATILVKLVVASA